MLSDKVIRITFFLYFWFVHDKCTSEILNSQGEILNFYKKHGNALEVKTLEEFNTAVSTLIQSGRARSKGEIAENLGYKSASAFSEVLKGRTKLTLEVLKKFQEAYPEEEPTGITRSKGIPYFDFEVTGGNLIQQTEARLHPDGFIVSPAFYGCDLALRVRGDSMMDSFNPGDIVGLKRIHDLDVISWGSPHVIFTKEQAMLKYLRRHEQKENIWVLRSHNSVYQDIEIHRSKILQIFLVKVVEKPLNF